MSDSRVGPPGGGPTHVGALATHGGPPTPDGQAEDPAGDGRSGRKRASHARRRPATVIHLGACQLRHATEAAFFALAVANSPPLVYRRDGCLVRIQPDGGGRIILRRLTGSVLRNHLARVADWYRDGRAVYPPRDVVADVEAGAEWSAMPELRGVITCPVVTAAGDIIVRPGYHKQEGVYYLPDPDFLVPDVQRRPSQSDVSAAVRLVNDNLLADFPWVDPEIDRPAAWAAMILPFTRPMIDGPTPLHMVEAPVPGSGKTLLAQAVMTPALGRLELEPMTVDCDESETRKRITACLRDAPNVVLLDNIGQGRRLESSSLASVLTSKRWRDRIIGSSTATSCPVTCVWLATANNPVLSAELMRRTVRCRLDPRASRPHMRTGFRHADLVGWARANRSSVVGAILTVVRAWLAAGRPGGAVRLGMYENWARVVGGILGFAGMGDGFGRGIELYQGAETDAEAVLRPFLRSWWQRFGGRAVGVQHLYAIAIEAGNLDDILDIHLAGRPRPRGRGAESDRSRQTRMGQALRRLVGQVYAGFCIRSADQDHSGRQMYRLEPLGDAEVPEAA